MVNVQAIKSNYVTCEAMTQKIIQNEESKTVRDYPGDLNAQDKSFLEAAFVDENTLKISASQSPHLEIQVRRQDIFESGADVIVNAANIRLGGGGGIDGAIHAKGGKPYADCHKDLQRKYLEEYVLGHAAMIDSGLLKENFAIEKVIVVAGPKGETNFEKESALYSCYYNSLVLADLENKTKIAFPSISTGIFEFPRDRAASISLKAIYDFLHDHPNTKLECISIHFLLNEPRSYLENYVEAAS